MNEKLYTASHDDDGGIYVVNFQDGTSEKVASNGHECSKVHSLMMYENSLMFSDTGDHSIKVFNPVTRECVYSRLFDGLLKDGKQSFSTENLREFAITFGLHQKKQTPVSFTLYRAISRIQDVYDFDCQCVNQVKAFLGTTAQTQGPQGTVSAVVLEDEKRILQALTDIKHLHACPTASSGVQNEESFDAYLRELLFGDESWIIQYAIAAPV